MNLFKRLGDDLKEYFKPENVKNRLKESIEIEQLKTKLNKVKCENNKYKEETAIKLRLGE